MGECSLLVELCIKSGTESLEAVNKWRYQKRSINRLPTHLAHSLMLTLFKRNLLTPSLLEIFKNKVEEVDVSGESCVDGEWLAYLGAFNYLTSLKLAHCYKINNHAIWPLLGLTDLKELDLSRCPKITDSGVEYILSFTSLEKLHISKTGVTSQGVSLLSVLTDLSVLDLGGLPVTDLALSSLRALTKLEYLDLWGSEITDEGARVLHFFPKLSFLNLAWTKVTELPYMSSLTVLNMSNCTIGSIFQGYGDKANISKLFLYGTTYLDISTAFLYFQASLLTTLDLSNCSLENFNFLSHMSALEHLDLSLNHMDDESVNLIALVGANLRFLNLSNTKITSAGVGILAGNVSKLEELLLSGTRVDDLAISYVSLMPSLKAIDISNTYIKGFVHQIDPEPEVSSLVALQNLPNLERLNMEFTQVTDEALDSLSGLGQLTNLSFRSNLLTDASLYLLSSVPKLTSLSVRDAVLTNAGLDFFKPPLTLKSLDLRGCWLLTEDVILPFCEKHPQIEIKHEMVIPSDKGKSNNSSPSQGNTKSLNLKQRQPKSTSSPLMPKASTFLDQRLKYSREELLALQPSSSQVITLR